MRRLDPYGTSLERGGGSPGWASNQARFHQSSCWTRTSSGPRSVWSGGVGPLAPSKIRRDPLSRLVAKNTKWQYEEDGLS